MVLFKRDSLTISIVLSSLLLTGCGYGTEYKQVKQEAIQIAKSYAETKYGDSFRPNKIKVDQQIAYGLPFSPPSGAVFLEDTSKGYTIYINTETGVTGDNKQLASLKEDIQTQILSTELMETEHTILDYKIFGINPYTTDQYYGKDEFLAPDMVYEGDLEMFLSKHPISIDLKIHFKSPEALEVDDERFNIYREQFQSMLTSLTHYFDSSYSDITLRLYKPDKYMNQDVLAILKEREEGIASIWQDYIYESDFVQLTAKANRDKESQSWNTELFSDYFLAIDNGLSVSSMINEPLSSQNQLIYHQYPIYFLTDQIVVYDNKTLEVIVDEELIERHQTNKSGDKVMSFVYDIQYEPSFTTASDAKLNIQLDKNTFENGILLSDHYKIGTIYSSSDGTFKIRTINENFITEDDEFIRFSIENGECFVIYQPSTQKF